MSDVLGDIEICQFFGYVGAQMAPQRCASDISKHYEKMKNSYEVLLPHITLIFFVVYRFTFAE